MVILIQLIYIRKYPALGQNVKLHKQIVYMVSLLLLSFPYLFLLWLVHSNRLSDSFRGRSPLATEADCGPLADMRPGAQSGFPNAASSEFNRHTFVKAHARKCLYAKTGKPSSTRARTGDLSRVKRT